MPINRKARKELKQYKQRYSSKATQQLLREDNPKGAAESLDKAELSRDILALHLEPSRRLFYSSVFALICVTLISIAWVWHWPKPHVTLDLQAYTASIRLAKDLHWQSGFGLPTDEILLDGQVELTALGLTLPDTANRLEVVGKGITIREIIIRKIPSSGDSIEFADSRDPLLEVERHDGFIDFYISEGIITGTIELQDVELLLFQDGSPEVYPVSGLVPESLTFTTADKAGAKIRLRLKTTSDWRLDTLQTSGMAFQHEVPPGSGNFVSSIIKGSVEILESKRNQSLLEKDRLIIKQPISTRLHLSFAAVDNESFALLFQGRVRSLDAGPKGVEQNLTPTLLTYFYHQKKLKFFWGSLVFVYGLLWSLRNLLKKG